MILFVKAWPLRGQNVEENDYLKQKLNLLIKGVINGTSKVYT